MPDFGSFVSGATGGAIAGSTFGPIGTAVGGVIGSIGSLFGKSAAEEREERFNNTKALVAQLKAASDARRRKELSQGITQIGKVGAGLASSARSGAASRAYATGRSDIESNILPVEQRANTLTNQTMGNFVQDTNRRFDQEQYGLDQSLIQAQFDYNGAPISPSAGDTLLTAGSAIGKFGQMQNYLNSLKDNTDMSKWDTNITSMSPKGFNFNSGITLPKIPEYTTTR